MALPVLAGRRAGVGRSIAGQPPGAPRHRPTMAFRAADLLRTVGFSAAFRLPRPYRQGPGPQPVGCPPCTGGPVDPSPLAVYEPDGPLAEVPLPAPRPAGAGTTFGVE